MLLTSAAVVATAGYLFHQRLVQTELSRAKAIASGLRIQLERLLSLGIELHRLQGFEDQCRDAVDANAGLSAAFVVDPAGRILFHSDVTRIGEDLGGTELWQRINDGHSHGHHAAGGLFVASDTLHSAAGQPLAGIVVAFPNSLIDAERNRLVMTALTVSMLAIAVGAVLLWLGFARFVARPIAAMLDSIERLRSDDHTAGQRLPSREFDELEHIVQGFNRLLDRVDLHEHALRQAKDVAVAASQAKSAFLANMSHELRTPLNAIIGMTSIVLMRDPKSPYSDYLNKSLAAARQLLAIINDVLDLSRIEAHKLPIAIEPFEPRQVLGSQVDLVDGQAREKGIALHVEIEQRASETRVLGDPLRIGQVLLNLLSNAIKFSDRGSIGVRLTLSAARGDRLRLRCEVSDEGIGIPEDTVSRLFQPFEQADSSATRRFGGTGLGLSISHNLVSLMGGRIDVASMPGSGSTFSVRLPLEEVAPPDETAAQESVDEEMRLRGVRVLAAEDVELNQLVLEDMLSYQGAEVTITENGVELLALIDADGADAFDVVLMDIQMPEMDGLEATRLLLQRTAELPVIGLTAHALAEDRQRCLDAGMVDHLPKPVDEAGLVAAILRHLPESKRVKPA